MVRVLVGPYVDDARRVEDDEIREGARADLAAVGEAELPRRHARHAVHGLLEREQPELARVAAEHAREGSPQARVRLARQARDAVGADHGAGVAHHGAHVVLAHRVDHRGDAGRVRDDVLGRGLRVQAEQTRELGDAPPLPLGVTGRGGDRDLLGRDAAETAGAAVEGAVLDDRAEPRTPGGVGVLVGVHVEALGLRALDQDQRLLHQPPRLLARGLVVRDLDREPRAPADLDRLAHRGKQTEPLVAHVGRVDAAAGRELARERRSPRPRRRDSPAHR
jgi:hypothetical protein